MRPSWWSLCGSFEADVGFIYAEKRGGYLSSRAIAGVGMYVHLCNWRGYFKKSKNTKSTKHRESPQTSAARLFLRKMPGKYPGSEVASSSSPVAAASAAPALKVG